MVIEGAQAFGLSQLHQLRGRVGRGAASSTCLLLYDPPLGETARARLEIMRATEDGFRIAEEDLALRGAGDLIGVQQSGLPRFRIADLETQAELMRVAQDDSRLLLDAGPGARLAARRRRCARCSTSWTATRRSECFPSVSRDATFLLRSRPILDSGVKDMGTINEQSG